jgi:hypothetical protein
MIRNYAIIRDSAAAAADAAHLAVAGLCEGRIQNEETFTDRMIGAIEERFHHLNVKGVSWSAMTLTAHQRNAQESEFGADLLGVLEIELPDFAVSKGFLAQAKLVEPDEGFSRAEFARLHKQCLAMLTHTPEAFVFLYTKTDIRVVPANSVLGLRSGQNPHVLYNRSIARFFREHFQSFIGDRRLHRADATALEELRADLMARRALVLKLGRG